MATQNKHTPVQSMLKAFRRDSTADMDAPEFTYPNLGTSAETARKAEYQLLREFWEAPEGSLEEEERARAAAIGNLILTAARIQEVSGKNRQGLAEWMTQEAAEIYGEPDPAEVMRILSAELATFEGMQGNEAVDQSLLDKITSYYRALGAEYYEGEPLGEEFREAAEAWGNVLRERFAETFEYFEQAIEGKERFSAREVKAMYEAALEIDKQREELFKNSSIGESDGTAMTYSEKQNALLVGMNTKYIPAHRVIPLYFHELLAGHGRRYLNGKTFDDELMRQGLPNNIRTEEGVTVFDEMAVMGEAPRKITDHYVNIALAMGMAGDHQVGRNELHELAAARDIIRAQAAGEHVDYEETGEKSWSSVNRAYRGSVGTDEAIAVSTKDIAYYDGFLRIGKFVNEKLQEGYSITEVMDYIHQAKFDPTNERHVAYVNVHGRPLGAQA